MEFFFSTSVIFAVASRYLIIAHSTAAFTPTNLARKGIYGYLLLAPTTTVTTPTLFLCRPQLLCIRTSKPDLLYYCYDEEFKHVKLLKDTLQQNLKLLKDMLQQNNIAQFIYKYGSSRKIEDISLHTSTYYYLYILRPLNVSS